MLTSMADDQRDPRQVRVWGWAALVIGILIASTYVLIQHPWQH
jgi:hypothetical protein